MESILHAPLMEVKTIEEAEKKLGKKLYTTTELSSTKGRHFDTMKKLIDEDVEWFKQFYFVPGNNIGPISRKGRILKYVFLLDDFYEFEKRNLTLYAISQKLNMSHIQLKNWIEKGYFGEVPCYRWTEHTLWYNERHILDNVDRARKMASQAEENTNKFRYSSIDYDQYLPNNILSLIDKYI
ncbi:hypothetical protein [Neobacillus mesonae]|uniref:hypothetical protein n=1 Tax=Neobacillus mesonae TaxID=1193713 RepID=UPI0008335E14|nr:hypothetical protein [Neobacillus mesonae]